MDHTVVTDVIDRDSRRDEFSRVGVAFVAHRVEFGGMDNSGRKSGKFGSAKRGNSGIGKVGIFMQVIGQVGLQRYPIEEKIFRERLTRRRCFLEIEHRAYQALRRYRRPGVSQRVLAHHGSKRAAGRVAANHQPCASIPKDEPCPATRLVAAIASSIAAGNLCSGASR
jgi:hypothetical protein